MDVKRNVNKASTFSSKPVGHTRLQNATVSDSRSSITEKCHCSASFHNHALEHHYHAIAQHRYISSIAAAAPQCCCVWHQAMTVTTKAPVSRFFFSILPAPPTVVCWIYYCMEHEHAERYHGRIPMVAIQQNTRTD